MHDIILAFGILCGGKCKYRSRNSSQKCINVRSNVCSVSVPESAYIPFNLFCIWWQGSEGLPQAPDQTRYRDHTGKTGLSSVGVFVSVWTFTRCVEFQ